MKDKNNGWKILSHTYFFSIDFIQDMCVTESMDQMRTRAVRGSDYSPAIALSEEKDKLV